MSQNPSERASGPATPAPAAAPAAAPLRGSAHITATEITGWTFDPADEARPLEARLLKDGAVLMAAQADLARPDVNRAFQIQGRHGFRFGPLALSEAEVARIGIEVRRGPDDRWQALDIPKGPRRARHYQSFDDVKGASNSAQKLRALRLGLLAGKAGAGKAGTGHPLRGLSVLDLGCNEGFFCGEALRQGAARVVGIDHSRQFVGLARARFPQAEFIQGSWWDVPPDERFDVILFLSAIHYEPEPAALAKKLLDHLTPTGTLILECGIAPEEGKGWKAVRRADGIRHYPTEETFVDEVMQPYAVRAVGQSVPQRGDPVPRRVYHCTPKGGMVLVVTGPTRTGKSTLADDLRRHDIPLVRTDGLLREILTTASPPAPGAAGQRLAAVVRRFPKGMPLFGKIGRAVAEECPDAFVDLLLSRCPPGSELFCIEGEILRHPPVIEALHRALADRRIRPWFVARDYQPAPAAAPAKETLAGTRGRIRGAALGALGRIPLPTR